MNAARTGNPWAGWVGAFALWLLAFGVLQSLGLDTLEGILYRDGDSLRHIATGDLMRAEATPRPSEPWAFTTEGQDWFNPSWLFNVALSHRYQYGGLWGVTLFVALLGMLAVALPVLVAGRHGGRFPLTILLAMLAAPLFLAGIAVRPQVVTLLLVPLTVALLWRVQEADRPGKLALVGLVALAVVWVNAHGGWPVYFTLVGFWGLGALVARQNRKFLYFLLTGMISLVAVALLNPYGYGIFGRIFGFFDDQPLTAAINEWQAFNPALHWLLLPFMVAFAGAIAFNFRAALGSPLVWAALFWLLLGLGSVRHLYVFAPLGLMAAAWLVAPKLPAGGLLDRLPAFTRWQQLVTLPLALAAGLFLLPWARGGVELSNTYTLAEEAAWLQANRPDARLLNRYNDGGVLVFALRGQPQIWIDDRAETLYPRDVQADAIRYARDPTAGPELAAKYAADTVLVPLGSPNERVFDDHAAWRRAFTGPDAVVFVSAN